MEAYDIEAGEMLRIHFTPDDVARVRIASDPCIAVELTYGANKMHYRSERLLRRQEASWVSTWRQHARRELALHPRQLTSLNRVTKLPALPEFLDPGPEHLDPAQRREPFADVPQQAIVSFLGELADHQRVPLEVAALGEDRQALRDLGRDTREFYELTIAPHLSALRTVVDADQAVRTRILREGGVQSLLDTLHPQARWQFPVLQLPLPGYPDWDVHLDGRGLVLQPSLLIGGIPKLLGVADPHDTPTLAYPPFNAHRWLAGTMDRGRPMTLEALLGATRCAVLCHVAASGGATTSGIAGAVHVSVSSASEHAAVLREAGLLTSLRHGRHMLHTLSPLGAALLAANPEPPNARRLERLG